MAWEAFQQTLNRANKYVGKHRSSIRPFLSVYMAVGSVGAVIRQQITFKNHDKKKKLF